jgi:hypothetical protein
MREGIRAGSLVDDPDIAEEEEGHDRTPETSGDED